MNNLTPDQIQLVKNTIAKGASDDELNYFLHWCKVNSYDPLKKEAHFILKKNKCPNCQAKAGVICDQCDRGYIRVPIFIASIGGILSRASRNPNYKGIIGYAVRENDDFAFDAINQFPIKHIFLAKDRGPLLGCWATVFYRDEKKPFSFWYPVSEYASAGGFVSKEMPELMLVTATYSIALRRSFPDDVDGATYSPEEFGGHIDEKTGSLVLNAPHIEPKRETLQEVTDRFSEQVPGETTDQGILEYRDEFGKGEVKVNGKWKPVSQTVAESGTVTEAVIKPFLDLFLGNKHEMTNHFKKHFGVATVAALTWEQVAALLACKRDNRYDPRWYADRIKEQNNPPNDDDKLEAELCKSYGFNPFEMDERQIKFISLLQKSASPVCLATYVKQKGWEDHSEEWLNVAGFLVRGSLAPGSEEFDSIVAAIQ